MTYISDFHFFLVIHVVDREASLIDEVIQTRVLFHQQLLYNTKHMAILKNLLDQLPLPSSTPKNGVRRGHGNLPFPLTNIGYLSEMSRVSALYQDLSDFVRNQQHNHNANHKS